MSPIVTGIIAILIVLAVSFGIYYYYKSKAAATSEDDPAASEETDAPVVPTVTRSPLPPPAGQCYVNDDCTGDKKKCYVKPEDKVGIDLGVCSDCNSLADCPKPWLATEADVCYAGTCTPLSKVPSQTCKTYKDCAHNVASLTKCFIPTGSLEGTCEACGSDQDCPSEVGVCRLGKCVQCTSDQNCTNIAGSVPGKCYLDPDVALYPIYTCATPCAENSDCGKIQCPGTTFDDTTKTSYYTTWKDVCVNGYCRCSGTTPTCLEVSDCESLYSGPLPAYIGCYQNYGAPSTSPKYCQAKPPAPTTVQWTSGTISSSGMVLR